MTQNTSDQDAIKVAHLALEVTNHNVRSIIVGSSWCSAKWTCWLDFFHLYSFLCSLLRVFFNFWGGPIQSYWSEWVLPDSLIGQWFCLLYRNYSLIKVVSRLVSLKQCCIRVSVSQQWFFAFGHKIKETVYTILSESLIKIHPYSEQSWETPNYSPGHQLRTVTH